MMPEYTLRCATGDDYQYCYRLTKRNMSDLFGRRWGDVLIVVAGGRGAVT